MQTVQENDITEFSELLPLDVEFPSRHRLQLLNECRQSRSPSLSLA